MKAKSKAEKAEVQAQQEKQKAERALVEADSAKALALEKEKEAQAQLAKVLEANKSTVKLLLFNARKKREEMAYSEAIEILGNAEQIGVLPKEIAKEYVQFIFYYAMADSSELVLDLVNRYGKLLNKSLPAVPNSTDNLANRYQASRQFIIQLAGKDVADALVKTYLPVMVEVKAGTMGIGSSEDYKVTLSDYRMAQSEVTVAQYFMFCEATNRACPAEPSFKWRQQDPVVTVDWYDDYPSEPQTSPVGPVSGYGRVYRGGSWRVNAGYCEVSYRFNFDPDFRYCYLGFRPSQTITF